MNKPASAPDVLPLIGGTPDSRLVPTVELSRAYRRALDAYGDCAAH